MQVAPGRNAKQLNSMPTNRELSAIAEVWLAPLDEVIGDLIEKSRTMTPGAFAAEVQRALNEVPGLFDRLDTAALTAELEDDIGAAVIRGLTI